LISFSPMVQQVNRGLDLAMECRDDPKRRE
jgi:hypothetical protein